MADETKLSLPISDLLAHARMLALHIGKHAARLGRASEKRVGAQTAVRLRNLVEDLEQLESDRRQDAVGSAEGLVRTITDHISAIAAAAQFASREHPLIAQQLKSVRASIKKRRSAADVTLGLHNHLGLLREHAKILGPLLPKTIVADSERALAALHERHDAITTRKIRMALTSRKRAEILREILAIASEVRELAAVLFRYEPELAQLFRMPKRRAARSSKKPRVEAPAPA